MHDLGEAIDGFLIEVVEAMDEDDGLRPAAVLEVLQPDAAGLDEARFHGKRLAALRP